MPGAARGVGEARKAIADPGAVLDGLRDGAGRLNVRLNPEATPPASTFGGEMRRQAGVGLNQGEMLFDLGSVLYGGAELKVSPVSERQEKLLGLRSTWRAAFRLEWRTTSPLRTLVLVITPFRSERSCRLTLVGDPCRRSSVTVPSSC